jgi:gas vesicle protein
VAKQELVPVVVGFNYSLVGDAADKVRSSAEKIRRTVQKTIEDIIEVGQELMTVKETVGHGHFGPWLRAEFGWTERTAHNFMNVADQFGPNTKLISDLAIMPTAAYLLAAPSVPEKARETAVERAEAGEQITTGVAKEIIAKLRKKSARKTKAVPTDKLGLRLTKALEKYKEQWNSKELSMLAQHLREFADSLEEKGGKKKAKGE